MAGFGRAQTIGQTALARSQRQFGGGERAGVVDQSVDIWPNAKHPLQKLRVQRIHLLAPVVARSLGAQGLFVGAQLFVKQRSTVKGVLAQHALAPGVDGLDGRVVHAFGRVGQPPGRLFTRWAGGVGIAQRRQIAVVRLRSAFAAQHARRLGQPGADAVGQFARGGAGKGHDQNVGGRERAAQAFGAAVAEHQPQVQRGNGPGLARTGARLDQAAAMQREMQRIEHRSAGGRVG